MKKRIAGLLGLLGLGGGTAAYANADYVPPTDLKVRGNWDGLIDEAPRLTNWEMFKTKHKLKKLHDRLATRDPSKADVIVPSGLHRVKTPKDGINLRALQYLDFTPSIVAVPERGQEKMMTFRQYGTNMHIHQHPKNLFIHKDKWPSIMMAWEETAGKPAEERLAAIKDGIKHVVGEGVPGYMEYFKNVVKQDPTFEDIVKTSSAKQWLSFKPREGNTLVPMKFEKSSGAYSPIITEVVETPHNAILGLSNLDSIPENYGMLFKEANGFWMPGVKFDLDIVYMDKVGCVQQIQRMVKVEGGIPPVYRPEKTAALALETLPGWCERNNINVGDKLTVNGD